MATMKMGMSVEIVLAKLNELKPQTFKNFRNKSTCY